MAVRLSALLASLAFIFVRAWVNHRAIVRLERRGKLTKKSYIIGSRTCDLEACSAFHIFMKSWIRTGIWRYSSTIPDLGTRLRFVVKFCPWHFTPRGKSSQYPVEKRQNLALCRELKPSHGACSYTELSWLSCCFLRMSFIYFILYIYILFYLLSVYLGRTVFARSNTEIVYSNPTGVMDVCVRLFCVCVVLCISSSLATGWSPVQGVLPTVY
jgi:hypothetical protein